jgi:hypothetical protein
MFVNVGDFRKLFGDTGKRINCSITCGLNEAAKDDELWCNLFDNWTL